MSISCNRSTGNGRLILTCFRNADFVTQTNTLRLSGWWQTVWLTSSLWSPTASHLKKPSKPSRPRPTSNPALSKSRSLIFEHPKTHQPIKYLSTSYYLPQWIISFVSLARMLDYLFHCSHPLAASFLELVSIITMCLSLFVFTRGQFFGSHEVSIYSHLSSICTWFTRLSFCDLSSVFKPLFLSS